MVAKDRNLARALISRHRDRARAHDFRLCWQASHSTCGIFDPLGGVTGSGGFAKVDSAVRRCADPSDHFVSIRSPARFLIPQMIFASDMALFSLDQKSDRKKFIDRKSNSIQKMNSWPPEFPRVIVASEFSSSISISGFDVTKLFSRMYRYAAVSTETLHPAPHPASPCCSIISPTFFRFSCPPGQLRPSGLFKKACAASCHDCIIRSPCFSSATARNSSIGIPCLAR